MLFCVILPSLSSLHFPSVICGSKVSDLLPIGKINLFLSAMFIHIYLLCIPYIYIYIFFLWILPWAFLLDTHLHTDLWGGLAHIYIYMTYIYMTYIYIYIYST